MTPQVQIWVHLDSEENAAGLAVKLQELIRSVRKEGKKAYGFVIWTQGEAVKDKLVKLAEDKRSRTSPFATSPTSNGKPT
jgi:hypothetical protein